MNKTELNKKAMIEALEQSRGVVTDACNSTGVGRTTFYSWIKNDKVFKNEVDNIEDVAIDFVESKLFKQIENGNITAIIFYLKTKGKKRGYVERTEISQTSKIEPLEFRIIKK